MISSPDAIAGTGYIEGPDILDLQQIQDRLCLSALAKERDGCITALRIRDVDRANLFKSCGRAILTLGMDIHHGPFVVHVKGADVLEHNFLAVPGGVNDLVNVHGLLGRAEIDGLDVLHDDGAARGRDDGVVVFGRAAELEIRFEVQRLQIFENDLSVGALRLDVAVVGCIKVVEGERFSLGAFVGDRVIGAGDDNVLTIRFLIDDLVVSHFDDRLGGLCKRGLRHQHQCR